MQEDLKDTFHHLRNSCKKIFEIITDELTIIKQVMIETRVNRRTGFTKDRRRDFEIPAIFAL